MNFRTTHSLLLFSLLLLVACGDDDGGIDGGIDTGLDGGMDTNIDTPSDSGGDTADVLLEDTPHDGADTGTQLCPTSTPALDGVSGAAVGLIASDFVTTSVSLIDEELTVLSADWITSGTTTPELTATLGGDVVFPTTAPGDGTVVLIDRFGSNVISRFCIESGTLVGQLSTGDFEANPYDVVIDGEVGYVSRYNPNPSDVGTDLGSDVIGFDATTMERNAFRADLSEFGGVVTGRQDGSDADVEIAARPGDMLLMGRTLVVALERTPVDQAGAARGFGEGTVAFIDLDSNAITSLTLPGAANCSQIEPGHEASEFYVACKGYSLEFFGGPGVRETAGIFQVTMEGTPSIVSSWRPMAGDPIAVWSLAAGPDSGTVAAVANGDFGAGTPDQFVVINLEEGTATPVFDGDAPFTLGQALWFDDGFLLPHRAEDPETVFIDSAVIDDGEVPDSILFGDSLPPSAFGLL